MPATPPVDWFVQINFTSGVVGFPIFMPFFNDLLYASFAFLIFTHNVR